MHERGVLPGHKASVSWNHPFTISRLAESDGANFKPVLIFNEKEAKSK